MDVVLLGAGNVSTVVGRSMIKAGHRITAIWNRHQEPAEILASEWNARAVMHISELPQQADLYVIAVSDVAIEQVAAELQVGEGIVVHMAGMVSQQVLSNTAKRYGVMWPMKMLRSSMADLGDCTIVIDGNDEATTAQLSAWAGTLTNKVGRADDHTRMKMHLVAAIVSNFTNHMYHLAADFCEQETIDFSLFYPLIEATAAQALTIHPSKAQAGPAFRGDRNTLEKHRSLITDEALLKLYDSVSESILCKFGHLK